MWIRKDQEPRRAEFEREALPHMDSLYNLALWMTKNREESEDLVQETYLRALRSDLEGLSQEDVADALAGLRCPSGPGPGN